MPGMLMTCAVGFVGSLVHHPLGITAAQFWASKSIPLKYPSIYSDFAFRQFRYMNGLASIHVNNPSYLT